MANVKIEDLTDGGAARSGDILPVDRSGQSDTIKATLPRLKPVAWSASIQFEVGDITISSSRHYYTHSRPPVGTAVTNASYFIQIYPLIIGGYYRGEWVTGAAYNQGDVVLHTGRFYTCLTAHTAGSDGPDDDKRNWAVQDNWQGTFDATKYYPAGAIVIHTTSNNKVWLAKEDVVPADPNPGASGDMKWIELTGGGGSGTITTITAGTGLSGGGSTATVTIGIRDGGVGETQLGDGAVTEDKIGDGEVTEDKVADDAITPDKLDADTETKKKALLDRLGPALPSHQHKSGYSSHTLRSPDLSVLDGLDPAEEVVPRLTAGSALSPNAAALHSMHFAHNGAFLIVANTYTNSSSRVWVVNSRTLEQVDSYQYASPGRYDGVGTLWDEERKRLYYPRVPGTSNSDSSYLGSVDALDIASDGTITRNSTASASVPTGDRRDTTDDMAKVQGPSLDWDGKTIVFSIGFDAYFFDVGDDGLTFRNAISLTELSDQLYETRELARGSGNTDTVSDWPTGARAIRVMRLPITGQTATATRGSGASDTIAGLPTTGITVTRVATSGKVYPSSRWTLSGNSMTWVDTTRIPNRSPRVGETYTVTYTVDAVIYAEDTQWTESNGVITWVTSTRPDAGDDFEVRYATTLTRVRTTSPGGAHAVRFLAQDLALFTFNYSNVPIVIGRISKNASDVYSFAADYFYREDDVREVMGLPDSASLVLTDDIGVLGSKALIGLENVNSVDQVFMLLKLSDWTDRNDDGNLIQVRPEIPDGTWPSASTLWTSFAGTYDDRYLYGLIHSTLSSNENTAVLRIDPETREAWTAILPYTKVNELDHFEGLWAFTRWDSSSASQTGIGTYIMLDWEPWKTRVGEDEAAEAKAPIVINVSDDATSGVATYDLEDEWESWKNTVIQFVVDAGDSPTVRIRPNSAGTWSPPTGDKGDFIEFHPLWESGRIELEDIGFARHNSDGRIKTFSALDTASGENATQGLGEPFRLIYNDYYVGSSLFSYHVMPLTQDIEDVLQEEGETTAKLTEVQALERKIEKIIHDLEGIAHPHHPLVPYPDPDPDNQKTWNLITWDPEAEVSKYEIKVEKGSHRLEVDVTFNDSTHDIYDGRYVLRNLGIREAKDDVVLCYVLPTYQGSTEEVTGAKLSLLLDVKTGLMLNPSPITLDLTVTGTDREKAFELCWDNEGNLSSIYWRWQTNYLSNNQGAQLLARARDSLRVYGSEDDLNAIRNLLEPDIGPDGASKMIMEDRDGDIDPYRITTISGNTTTDVWNDDMHHMDLEINVNADHFPAVSQSLHFAVDESGGTGGVTEDFSLRRVASGDVDVTTAKALVASGVTLPNTGIFAVTFGASRDASSVSPQVDLKFIFRQKVLDLDAAAAGDAVSLTNAIIIGEHNNSWVYLGRTSNDELLITSDATGTDFEPLVVYAVSGLSVTEEDSGDVAISTATLASTAMNIPDSDIFAVTLGARSNSEQRQENIIFIQRSDLKAVDAAEDEDAYTRENCIFISEGRGTRYALGHTTADEILIATSSGRDCFPLTVYSVEGIEANRLGRATIDVTTGDEFYDTDITKPDSNTTPYMAATIGAKLTTEAPVKNLVIFRTEELERANFAAAAGNSAGKTNAIQWEDHGGGEERFGVTSDGDILVASSGTSNDFRPLEIFEITPSERDDDDDGVTGQDGSYVTIRTTENLSYEVAGEHEVNLGGANGWALDDKATHMEVTITIASDETRLLTLYYRNPTDDVSFPVIGSDGNSLQFRAGESKSARFSASYMKTISGKKRLRLLLHSGSSATPMTGAAVQVRLKHETDAHSANVERLTLLDSSVTIAASAMSSGLVSTHTMTRANFAHKVEWERVVSLSVHIGTHPNLANEAAEARLIIPGDELAYVGPWSGDLHGRTDMPAWVSIGWLAIGQGNQLAAWRSRPNSSFINYYAGRSNAAGRIIGFRKSGVYLDAIYGFSWTGPLVIHHISCMRRV